MINTNAITNSKVVCPCREKEQNYSKNNLNNKVIKCNTCNTLQHESCMKESGKIKNYQCPGCQLNDSDPFMKVVAPIMPPFLIKNEGNDMKVQTYFQVSSEVSKIMEQGQKGENAMLIMIRCLRLDEDGYEHHWPFNFSVSLNANQLKSLVLPKYPPRSKSRVDHPLYFYSKIEDYSNNNYHYLAKDHFFPINKFINFSQLSRNVIDARCEFAKNDNDKYNYCLSVDLVEIIKSPQEVIKSQIPLYSDVNILRKLFRADKERDYSESLLFSERVSLTDCYTRSKKIKIPARGLNCIHLGVFDLEVYLSINRKNKTYNCPLCMKKATRLYIDGYVQKLIEENQNSVEITLSPDYEENVVNTKTMKREAEECEKIKKPKEIKSKSITESAMKSSEKQVVDFVDLDADEESSMPVDVEYDNNQKKSTNIIRNSPSSVNSLPSNGSKDTLPRLVPLQKNDTNQQNQNMTSVTPQNQKKTLPLVRLNSTLSANSQNSNEADKTPPQTKLNFKSNSNSNQFLRKINSNPQVSSQQEEKDKDVTSPNVTSQGKNRNQNSNNVFNTLVISPISDVIHTPSQELNRETEEVLSYPIKEYDTPFSLFYLQNTQLVQSSDVFSFIKRKLNI